LFYSLKSAELLNYRENLIGTDVLGGAHGQTEGTFQPYPEQTEENDEKF
jgi:hypothetical protein